MKHNYFIDILRTYSMFWIVCIYHMLGYTPLYSIQGNAFADGLTTLAMAVFMFISGYLLSLKYGGESVWRFYKKRIVRILPLSIIAILLFPNNASIIQRINNCAGLAPLVGGGNADNVVHIYLD